MKLSFLGAARTVTGSCYILEAAGRRLAVDCGLHQGNAEIESRNVDMAPYRPKDIGCLLVTHTHMDHAGLIPRLVKEGFSGPIYCTTPTADLLGIMLADSANLQEMEAERENEKRARRGQPGVEPLYTQEDAVAALKLVKAVPYLESFAPMEGFEAKFLDAGHILGSAIIELCVTEGGSQTKLVFSGDLGRPGQLLIDDPDIVETADYLLMESTYGDRDHKDPATSRDELAQAINYAYKNGEKALIPAFALERSQEVIYSIYLLLKEGKVPADIKVYLDSPLAVKATRIFMEHPEYMDEETRALIKNGENPLQMSNLRLVEDVKDSQKLNTMRGPAVIISASGMANAGRIRHHLKHNLWRPGAAIIFTGFQAMGTTGRRIVDGAKTVNLFGEDVQVKAKVFTIGGFSAHAGKSQMLAWLGNFRSKKLRVLLVHGEAATQESFAKVIREKFGFEVHIPEYQETMTLEPGRAPEVQVDMGKARPQVDWDYLLTTTGRLLDEFRSRLDDARAKDWADQAELRGRLLNVNQELMKLNSEL